MKNSYLMPFLVTVLFTAASCEKQSSAAARKIAELEQKTMEAAARQRELEQELTDQKLAAEWDAVERERMRIEDHRAELEQRQGVAAAEQDEALRQREEALATREVKLEEFQSSLEEKEDEFHARSEQLGERDRELAGREALAFEESAQMGAVADYGMFYDSLASYGSWFETPDYGYVWQPVVVSDSRWRPYSRGRWICSDRGWTWVSDEPFGWATYHYGRWALLRDRGWIWVPGSEWAPSWVSWRESKSHIGWAPLPPETLAYRGHTWDSAVDVQFGISASCYNFVEIRYFGSSLYNHCLPISANGGYFQQTANITYIHIVNRQVICGGPKYKKVCEAVRRPLPFYRLEIDHHPRPSRDSLGMRPRIKEGRLVVSAPNMDVAWNDALKPKRIKDRIETVTVERSSKLGEEITDRYRQSRDEARQRSEAPMVGRREAERSDQFREDDRRLADGKGQQNLPHRAIPGSREPDRAARPAQIDPVAERVVRQPNGIRPRPELMGERKTSVGQDAPQVIPAAAVDLTPEPRAKRPAEDRRVSRANASPNPVETPRVTLRQDDAQPVQRMEAMDRSREEQARDKQREVRQNEAAQARSAQQEAIQRKQEEQAQQQKLRIQREADPARESKEREHARQQEHERSRRQHLEDQQRQAEESRQRQQEQARQRQHEENQREQERAHRQQEDNQRQRQQEESRQQQEKAEKDRDDERKRNR